ncbi:hypothetical protein HDV00_004271 [Rhizophlyctis rosea]|nr:hypothetical protein HDV00_004271 [Rhizophlyctis rosea]
MSYFSQRPQTQQTHPQHRRTIPPPHSKNTKDTIFDQSSAPYDAPPQSTSRADYTDKTAESRRANASRGSSGGENSGPKLRYAAAPEFGEALERIREGSGGTGFGVVGGDDFISRTQSTQRRDFTIPGFDPDLADRKSKHEMMTKPAGRPIPKNSTTLQYTSPETHAFLASFVPQPRKHKSGQSTFADYDEGGGHRWDEGRIEHDLHAGLTVRIAGK